MFGERLRLNEKRRTCWAALPCERDCSRPEPERKGSALRKSERELVFDPAAFEDFEWWILTNRKLALKIVKLIVEVQRTPFEGSGKPEPLKHELAGCWSRRIDGEHRLVYEVTDSRIRILACRFHY